jgi:hypothetical protein
MSRQPSLRQKVFSVEEANRALPLVRAIVSDLCVLWQDVIERRQRLAHLTADRELELGDPYGDELADIARELSLDAERVQEYLDELNALGVEAKGPEGLVDFPAMLDGRAVNLCWKLGEPEVLYWHELDTGFAGRQPLTAGSISEDSRGSEGSYEG